MKQKRFSEGSHVYGTRDQEETSSITSQSNNQKVSEMCVYVCMHKHIQCLELDHSSEDP